VFGSNRPRFGTLVYVDDFTRDFTHECGEASLGFPHEVLLEKKFGTVSTLHLK
jgi:hypothetical protein